MKSVFVTVGTTSFDKLVHAFDDETLIRLLSQNGYTDVLIQIGAGTVIPRKREENGVSIDYYRFKPSLNEDFQKASLVISHAGAASCIEALEAGKKLLTVVNRDLMNNHQKELANALQSLNFCRWCYPENIGDILEQTDFGLLEKYKPGNACTFVQYLNNIFFSNSG